MVLRLSLIAVLIAWYQLPVLLERSAEIPDARISEPLHADLKLVTDTIGRPVIALRDTVEQWKADKEAAILNASWSTHDVGLAPLEVATAAAVSVPAVEPVAQAAVSRPALAATVPARQPAMPGAAESSATPSAPASTSAPQDASTSATSGSPASGMGPVGPSEFAQPKTVVLMGDSVMGEIFFSFKRWSSRNTAWKAIDGHKDSSGLCNTEYYDWPKVAAQLVTDYKPQIVVLALGPNDAQDIVLEHHWVHFGTDAWKVEYAARTRRILEVASSQGAQVYWPVLPVMREPAFEKKMAVIREVQAEVLATMPRVKVVDTSASFRDANGRYEQKGGAPGRVRELRAKDGIHLAPAGADIVVEGIAVSISPDTVAVPAKEAGSK